MADKKISQLTERTSFVDTDLLHMVAGDTNYKAQLANLLANQREDRLEIFIDGGGSAVAADKQEFIEVGAACTVTRARLYADQSCTAVVDLWSDTFANFPPVDVDSICGGNELSLSTAQKVEDATLSGWTTALGQGDGLMANVDSNDNATWFLIVLWVEKNLP